MLDPSAPEVTAAVARVDQVLTMRDHTPRLRGPITMPRAYAIRYRLGQGNTRAAWTGPAGRHPGYVRVVDA